MRIDAAFGNEARLANGVRARADGQGDAWAEEHRQLGIDYLMQDLDAMFGCVVFGQNTGERLFLEYVPDNYENRCSSSREFALVAMFDRKTTDAAAFGNGNQLSSNVYRWVCRKLSAAQPNPARFFYVIGGQLPPWTMIEVDVASGERIGAPEICSGRNFKSVWEKLGLITLRSELKSWVQAA